MSDPYGFGIANPTDQPIQFSGETPLPQSVSSNDSGISQLKANADHSHGLNIGGVDTPWFNLPLGPACTNYAGGGAGGATKPAQYTRVGNMGLIRGVVGFLTSTSPVQIGVVPPEFRPSLREIGIGYGAGGAFEVDLWTDGQLIMTSGPSVSPFYLSIGSPYFIYIID
jgi:hypothetical protein